MYRLLFIDAISNDNLIFARAPNSPVSLGPLHMSPVTGLARLPGRILSSVHMGNFSPVTGMKKSRKGRETWTEALGTSLSAKFKKVNKDGATFNSYIVRSHRSVINARSSSATTSRGPFQLPYRVCFPTESLRSQGGRHFAIRHVCTPCRSRELRSV